MFISRREQSPILVENESALTTANTLIGMGLNRQSISTTKTLGASEFVSCLYECFLSLEKLSAIKLVQLIWVGNEKSDGLAEADL